MGTQAPDKLRTIESTMDYRKFLTIGGNRNVDLKHVNQLKSEMQRNPDLFAALPVLVNENWFVIDGQHRLEAAKQLNLPIYYIQEKGVGLADTRQMNIAQRRWRIHDFAKSYADSGRPAYVELLKAWKQYNALPLSIVANYLGGTAGGGSFTSAFARGEFQILDPEISYANLDFLTKVLSITGRRANNAFAAAIQKVLAHPDFDEELFLSKLQEAPEMLEIYSSARASIRNIEDIFNRRNKITVRLER